MMSHMPGIHLTRSFGYTAAHIKCNHVLLVSFTVQLFLLQIWRLHNQIFIFKTHVKGIHNSGGFLERMTSH